MHTRAKPIKKILLQVTTARDCQTARLNEQELNEQGLFQNVRVCVQFFRKRARKCLKKAKKGNIFENLGKNIQNLKKGK